MKTILISAYAVNPYKGSEDGTGWNILRQIAMRNRIVLITRENNRPHLEKYMAEKPEEWHSRAEFQYFDLPKWSRFWKRGGRGAMLYFMLWQLAMPSFIRKRKLKFDIAHQLNFHNDWLPTLLWRLKKPVVWGPIGHHLPIPAQYLKPIYGWRAWGADRKRGWIKVAARKLNPLYHLSLRKVSRILAISNAGQERANLPSAKTIKIPAVGAVPQTNKRIASDQFTILSVGRFVPLKGFDVTIRSFAAFLSRIEPGSQSNVRLCLVGKGPEKERLMAMAAESGCRENIEFVEWMPQESLMDLYRQSDLFLFPSHEGAGMVVAEALSFGLPLICFDNAGPGELITDECGVKIPHKSYGDSVNSFANVIEALYSNASLRQKMSRAALAHIKNNLSWDAKGEAIQNVYQSILENE